MGLLPPADPDVRQDRAATSTASASSTRSTRAKTAQGRHATTSTWTRTTCEELVDGATRRSSREHDRAASSRRTRASSCDLADPRGVRLVELRRARCSTAARSASPTTWAPRSTWWRWCSATSARTPAPACASPATRPPARQGVYGDYLQNAQGEDVVAGIRNTVPLAELEQIDKASYDELLRDHGDARAALPRPVRHRVHHRARQAVDAADPGRASGPPAAAFRIADPAGRRGPDRRRRGAAPGHRRPAGAADVPAVRHRRPTPTLLATGMAASPGAAVGKAVFDSGDGGGAAAAGEKVILVRRETNPDDLPGMIAAEGILTSRGGKTSPRRGRRPRDGQDLRVRRRGARRRHRAPRRVTAPDGTGVDEGDVDLHRRLDRGGLRRRGAGGAVAGGAVLRGRRSTRRGEADDAGRGGATGSCSTPTRCAGCGCGPTPTPPRTPSGPAGSARRASGCAAPSTCSSASGASYVERLILAEDDEERDAALADAAAAAAADFVEILDGDGRAARSPSGCSTRRCTSSCPTSPSSRCGWRWPRRAARPTSRTCALLGAVQRAARAEPDARPARGPARAGRARAVRRCRSARSPRRPRSSVRAGARSAAGDHGAAGRRRAGAASWSARRPSASSPRSPSETGVDAAPADRHHDRAAAGGADRRARSPRRPTSSRSAPTTSPRPPGGSPATTSRRAFFSTYLEQGHLRRLAVRDRSTSRASGELVRIGDRRGPRDASPDLKIGVCGEHGGDPRVHPLLPRRRAGLRLLLAVPGAGRPARGGPQHGRGR